MEQIKERIVRAKLWDRKVERELKALWKYGIDRISDPEIRFVVISFLKDTAPLGFFVNPASASHMHHPSWQCTKAGILRNTTECCLLVDRMLQNEQEFCDANDTVRPLPRDIVLAATIVSDTFKHGDKIIDPANPQKGLMDRNHGPIAAKKWLEVIEGIPEETRSGKLWEMLIYNSIYWHHGRWTPGWTPEMSFSKLMWITHQIDTVFTEKALELAFEAKEIIE